MATRCKPGNQQNEHIVQEGFRRRLAESACNIIIGWRQQIPEKHRWIWRLRARWSGVWNIVHHQRWSAELRQSFTFDRGRYRNAWVLFVLFTTTVTGIFTARRVAYKRHMWQPGVKVRALVSINEVALHPARLLLEWVDCLLTLCNQPPRSTQPAIPPVCSKSTTNLSGWD